MLIRRLSFLAVILFFNALWVSGQTTPGAALLHAMDNGTSKSYSVKVGDSVWDVFTFINGEFVKVESTKQDPAKGLVGDVPLNIDTKINGGTLTFALAHFDDLLNKTAIHIVFNTGEVMASEFLNKTSFTINTSDYPKGRYYYQVAVQRSKPFIVGGFEIN